METNTAVFKKLKLELPYETTQKIHPYDKPKGTESRLLKDVYARVHSNIIHNSQEMKAIKMSANGQIDKQNGGIYIYTHNGTLFSLKRGGNFDMLQYGWTLRTLC